VDLVGVRVVESGRGIMGEVVVPILGIFHVNPIFSTIFL